MSDNPIEPVVQPGAAVTPEPDFSQNALWKKSGGDWPKANDSYFNAVSELGKTHEQLNSQKAERARLEAMVMAAAGGKGPDNQNPFAELESLGISSKAIEDALDTRAQAIVEKQLGTFLAPLVTQIEAEEKLASEIDNFDQHKAEARSFMKKNEEVGEVFKALVQTNPVAAWKYAIRETLIDKQSKGTRTMPAGLPGGRATGDRAGRETVLSDDHKQREEAAAKYLRDYGDSAPYLNERFKGTSVERAVRNAFRQIGYDPDNQ